MPSACITVPRRLSSSPAACSGARTSASSVTSSSCGTEADGSAAVPTVPVSAPAIAAAAATTAPAPIPASSRERSLRSCAAIDQAVPTGRQPPTRTPTIPAGSHIAPIASARPTSRGLVGSPLVTPRAMFAPGITASSSTAVTSTTELSTT